MVWITTLIGETLLMEGDELTKYQTAVVRTTNMVVGMNLKLAASTGRWVLQQCLFEFCTP